MRLILALVVAALAAAVASADDQPGAPATAAPATAAPATAAPGTAAPEPAASAIPGDVAPVEASAAVAAPPPVAEAGPAFPEPEPIVDRGTSRNFVGSVQLDYLAVQHRDEVAATTFDGATVELSLKLAMDLGHHVTATVKVCYACHGLEVGMAYFDLRAADELAARVGRFSPAFGSFPLRHDPANHSTSDKPLAYDMGRMVRFRDWNEGVLPAPWVDNGLEINGSHFVGPAQFDYAVYAMAGPKGDSDGVDFDFTQSRSGERYYVDNNGEPMVGGRVSLTVDLAPRQVLTVGGSVMTGHYDPKANLAFAIAGADATLQLGRTFLRAEWLGRWTDLALGADPSTRFKYGPVGGSYAQYFYKDGYDFEIEHPIGRVTLLARWDGLRRSGNVLATSGLSARSSVQRYTVGVAIRVAASLQVKTSVERYLFSDFPDDNAAHLSLAGPF